MLDSFFFCFAPIFLEMAEELTDVENLVIAEMDATANEVDEV